MTYDSGWVARDGVGQAQRDPPANGVAPWLAFPRPSIIKAMSAHNALPKVSPQLGALSDAAQAWSSAGIVLEAVSNMARWPRQTWTTIYTYAVIFVLFPLCCVLAYGWVRGWR